jgi:hypothetical protein
LEIIGLSTSIQYPVRVQERAALDKERPETPDFRQTRLEVVDEAVLVDFGYDLPSSQTQGAIAAYQSVNGLEQRESISTVFGIDLYA